VPNNINANALIGVTQCRPIYRRVVRVRAVVRPAHVVGLTTEPFYADAMVAGTAKTMPIHNALRNVRCATFCTVSFDHDSAVSTSPGS